MGNDSKMDGNMFNGSAPFEYHPSHHLEAGISASLFHSISAMSQYEKFSFEELRMEDYDASGGFFGSTIAKLGVSLCDHPGVRRSPYSYGTVFNDWIGNLMCRKQDEHNNETLSPAAKPVDVFQEEKPVPTVNLSLQGTQNVTVFINGETDVIFSFNVASHESSKSKSSSSLKSSSSTSRSSSYDRADRKTFDRVRSNVKIPKHKTEKSLKKESARKRHTKK